MGLTRDNRRGIDMYNTWEVYEKVDTGAKKYLVYTGVTVQARTKSEAVREGSKGRVGAMVGFVMIDKNTVANV